MTESTKRVLRTIYQLVVALGVGIPAVLIGLPADVATSTALVTFAAIAAAVTKIINSLEDAGVIPAWLKS